MYGIFVAMEDSYRHKGLRKQMVARLREKGINDTRVLKAIENVPRHLFLNSSFLEKAYEEIAFPIGEGQTISHPYTVAFQTEILNIKKGDKVLEVGTGCGYQTAVLMEMGAKVFSIERQKKLFDITKTGLPLIGYNPHLYYGDGYKGQPAFAPFDKIIVTAGSPIIPDDLISQLKLGGRMVIPVGENSNQAMTQIDKTADGKIVKRTYGDFKFVPLLEEKEWGDA